MNVGKRVCCFVLVICAFYLAGCRTDNKSNNESISLYNPPFWIQQPSNITVNLGKSYFQSNGVAFDPNGPTGQMTCGIVSSTCPFNVYVGGAGTGAVSCQVGIVARPHKEHCEIGMAVLGHSAGPITHTISIDIKPVDYLIITANGLAPWAETIRSYRDGTGHCTAILRMSEIIAGMTAPNLETEIKNRIFEVYDEGDRESPFYVLLVGPAQNPSTMSTEYVPTKIMTFSRGTMQSDNWYADVDGDVIPEIAIGRLPYQTSAEVALYFQKLVNYESTYTPGEWNRKLSFWAGSPGFGGIYDAEIESMAMLLLDRIPYTYDLNMTYYSTTSPYFWVPADFDDKVHERINDGALAMTYIGHGAPTSVEGLVSNDLADLHPVGRPPMINLIACSTGDFLVPNGLAVMLMKGDNGIPSVLGATAISDPIVNAMLAMEMIHEVFTAKPKTLGEGMLAVKDGLVNRQGDELHDFAIQALNIFEGLTPQQVAEFLNDSLNMYTLFGDPALVLPFPRGKVTLTTDAPLYQVGSIMTVTGVVDNIQQGHVTLTLEVPRLIIAYPVSLPLNMADPNVNNTIRTNYANANNKIFAAAEIDFSTGTFSASFPLPVQLGTGTYYIKAYAQSNDTDAVGSTNFATTDSD